MSELLFTFALRTLLLLFQPPQTSNDINTITTPGCLTDAAVAINSWNSPAARVVQRRGLICFRDLFCESPSRKCQSLANSRDKQDTVEWSFSPASVIARGEFTHRNKLGVGDNRLLSGTKIGFRVAEIEWENQRHLVSRVPRRIFVGSSDSVGGARYRSGRQTGHGKGNPLVTIGDIEGLATSHA